MRYLANIMQDLAKTLAENLVENLVENLAENLVENLDESLAENLVENLDENLAENLAESLVENLDESLAEYLDKNLIGSWQDWLIRLTNSSVSGKFELLRNFSIHRKPLSRLDVNSATNSSNSEIIWLSPGEQLLRVGVQFAVLPWLSELVSF